MDSFYIILKVPMMSPLDNPRYIAGGIAESLECDLAGVFANCDTHEFMSTCFVKGSVAVLSGGIYERDE